MGKLKTWKERERYCLQQFRFWRLALKYHGMPKKRYFKFDMVTAKRLYGDLKLEDNTAKTEETMRKFAGFSL